METRIAFASVLSVAILQMRFASGVPTERPSRAASDGMGYNELVASLSAGSAAVLYWMAQQSLSILPSPSDTTQQDSDTFWKQLQALTHLSGEFAQLEDLVANGNDVNDSDIMVTMEQSEYDTLLAFCCDCKYPPECSKNEKDCIRRRAKNFIVKEGLFFYRDQHNKEYRVVTKKEKMKVLDGCHSAELGGGHFGRDKTLLKISERFYWIGMVNDVKEYAKHVKSVRKLIVKDEVWHTIGVDLIGPLPETQKGNKYIMTVSCLFSKWPEATALPDRTATGVAEFLFLCFTRHGCCKVKSSDQGREFVKQVNDELCRLCGIQCNMTSAYHPQSNGLDERFNQTLQRQLLKFVESEQNSWDQLLDAILFSYRCPGASERCDKPEDRLQQTIIECNIKTMVDVRKKALENIMKAQGRQKVYYDQVHCKDGREKYKVGTLVLLKNSKKLSKKGSKMEPNWTGPYLIHEVLSKGTYRLSKPNPPFQVLAQKYNMTRLKIFYQKDQTKDSHPTSEVQVDVGVKDEEQQTSNVQGVLT
eukprot:Em0011g209a